MVVRRRFALPQWLQSSATIGGVVLLIGVAISIAVGRIDTARRLSDERSRAIAELATVRARLEGVVKATFNTTQGLVDLISTQGTIAPELFNALAAEAMRRHPNIRNIALAPNDTIQHVYPLAGNEPVIGKRYADIPEQYATVQRARELGEPVLSGPLMLIQGGTGLILRAPVFSAVGPPVTSSAHYWGMVSIVANDRSLLEAGGITAVPGLSIGLRGKDGRGAAGGWIWGDPRLAEDQPVRMTVTVPGGSWELLAVRAGGWSSRTAISSPYYYLGIANSLLLAWIISLLIRRQRQVREQNLALNREVAERTRAAADLAVSEKRYRELYESMTDAYSQADMTGRFTACNRAFLAMVGYTADEVRERTYEQITPERWHQYEARIIAEQVLIRGYSDLYEKEYRRKDGTILPVELRSYLLRDEQGAPDQIWAIIRDVSDRKQAEAERLELERRLQHAQKLESLGVLAGGIAHDFNNLLGSLFGYLDLARLQNHDATITPYLERTFTIYGRAKDLTQRLLTFAKGGAPNRKPGPVASLIREAASFSLSGAAVACTFSLPDDLWWADYDENQLGQVIENLVINAQQAMPQGGTIAIAASNVVIPSASHGVLPPGRYLAISLHDNGNGIPPEILPHIFDPFFTTKQHGSGLGLATSYSIIQKHGGTIEVESQQGQGSTFRLLIPAIEPQLPQEAGTDPAVTTGHGRILVMDDEECMREVVQEMLTTLGYEVTTVADGTAALAQVHAAHGDGRPFAAVILDLTVPGGLGGRPIAAVLRQSYPNLPLIAASGYAVDPIMANPRDFDFSDRIEKPFRLTELAKLLARVLASAGTSPS
jgi:PAS domain S-box-containing protein